MKKEDFDLEKFKKDNGLDFKLEPYDYEKYKNINPKLTITMYEFLRGNGSLWKVKCGKRVTIAFSNEVLEAVWWRDTEECFCNRYRREE